MYCFEKLNRSEKETTKQNKLDNIKTKDKKKTTNIGK